MELLGHKESEEAIRKFIHDLNIALANLRHIFDIKKTFEITPKDRPVSTPLRRIIIKRSHPPEESTTETPAPKKIASVIVKTDSFKKYLKNKNFLSKIASKYRQS